MSSIVTEYLLYSSLFFGGLCFSVFLNFISVLYSSIDLSSVDLTKKATDKSLGKLFYILRHNYLIFIVVCFLQTFLNIILSTVGLSYLKWINENISTYLAAFVLALFLVFVTEILSRYLVEKKISQKLIKNSFLLGSAYFLAKFSSLLGFLVKPKKKIFTNTEQDLIRIVNNLTTVDILEKKEARLINNALKFDEEKVETAFIPYWKSIFLSSEMNWEKVCKIYLENSFSRYPVWKKKKLIGILNFKLLNIFLTDEKIEDWQQFISEEIIFLSVDTKLSVACDILKKSPHHLAIVKKKSRTVGIITLEDILEKLIGKINHNKKNKLSFLKPPFDKKNGFK